MPLIALTSENIKQVAKDTGRSEEELKQFLQKAAAKREPAWVQVPFPKHLR